MECNLKKKKANFSRARFSYVLFSIGNVKPLFEAVFANCWDSKEVCNPQWLNAIEYLEIVGIIVGQILVGIVGDWYVFPFEFFYFIFIFWPSCGF